MFIGAFLDHQVLILLKIVVMLGRVMGVLKCNINRVRKHSVGYMPIVLTAGILLRFLPPFPSA